MTKGVSRLVPNINGTKTNTHAHTAVSQDTCVPSCIVLRGWNPNNSSRTWIYVPRASYHLYQEAEKKKKTGLYFVFLGTSIQFLYVSPTLVLEELSSRGRKRTIHYHQPNKNKSPSNRSYSRIDILKYVCIQQVYKHGVQRDH